MLHQRNFFRLFVVNKLNSNTYSSWRNSTTTFGHQFLQIQNGNGCQLPCNIPFNNIQLCKYCQLFNANEGIEQKQHLGSLEKRNDENEMDLETRYLELNNTHRDVLKLKLQKGKSGNKTFRIEKNRYLLNRYWLLANIPVPEDAYPFVHSLDELIRELAAEDFEQKLLQIAGHNYGRETTNQLLKLRTVELAGLFHYFQLELLFSNKDSGRGMMEREIFLGLCAVNKIKMWRNRLMLPLHVLPWLRKHMAELLALYDGTEPIEIKAPSQIPQKFLISMKNE